MAVAAKFVADFTSFNAALDRADQELAKFETGIASVDRGLAKFGNQFSGQKIVQDATNAAAAIEAIGGTSKLTESELARVSAMAGEAAAKLRAMGQDVPPKLQALADAVKVPSKEVGLLSTVAGQAAAALAGMFTIRAVANFTRDVIAAGDTVGDLSERTGIGAAALQAFDAMAKKSGTSLESMVGVSEKLGIALAKDGGAAGAMKELGLRTQDLLAMRPEDRFAAVMTALGGITNEAIRNRIGVELMGRGFTEVAGLATTAFEETRRALEANGTGFTDAQVALLSRAADTMDRFKRTAQVLFAELLVTWEKAATVDLRFWDRVMGVDQFNATLDRVTKDLADMAADWQEVLKNASANTQGIDALDKIRESVSAAQREYRGLSETTKAQVRDMVDLTGKVKETAEAFGISEGAVQRLVAMDKLQEEQTKKNTDATQRRIEAEKRLNEAHQAQIQAIRDQLFGDDVIKKAAAYAEAIGNVENVTRLSGAAQADLAELMGKAILAMHTSGKASTDLTATFHVLQIAAMETGAQAATAFQQTAREAEAAAAASAAAATVAAEPWEVVFIGALDKVQAKTTQTTSSIMGAADRLAEQTLRLNQVLAGSFANPYALNSNMTLADMQAKAASLSGTIAYDDYNNPYVHVSGQNAPGRAGGGPVTAGQPYMVGESGPELFVPRTGGSIVPNGAGVTVHVNVDAREGIWDNSASARRLAERVSVALLSQLRGRGLAVAS